MHSKIEHWRGNMNNVHRFSVDLTGNGILLMLCRAVASEQANGTSAVPEPVVKIDNQSDAFATIVTVEFGDRLGELLDTVSVFA